MGLQLGDLEFGGQKVDVSDKGDPIFEDPQQKWCFLAGKISQQLEWIPVTHLQMVLVTGVDLG